MPPAPELGDRRRLVGGVEVLREAEAEEQGDADSHVRIAREVAVDLQGVAVDARETLETRVEQRFVEDAVDEVERDEVGDDGFLEQTAQNQKDARAEHFARHHHRILPDLGDEVARPHDRSRYQLGEEREVEQVVEPIVQRPQAPAVDVDGVAHRLEDEERNADGQEDVLELEESLAEKLVGYLDEEVGVLEVGQHPQIDGGAQRHEPPLGREVDRAENGLGDQIVARGGEDQQQEVDAARLIIEVERKEDDVDDAQRGRAAQGGVEKQEPREQKQEKPAAEDQRRRGVVGEQRFDPGDQVVCGRQRHGLGGLIGWGRQSSWRRMRSRWSESMTGAPSGCRCVRRAVRMRLFSASNSAWAMRVPPA